MLLVLQIIRYSVYWFEWPAHSLVQIQITPNNQNKYLIATT